VQFIVSADTVFSKIGNVTGINYQNRFWSYKKLLTTMVNQENIQNLYKFWDSIVFSHLTAGASGDGEASNDGGGAESGDAEVDEMEELMNELQLPACEDMPETVGEVPDGSNGNGGQNDTAGNQIDDAAGVQAEGSVGTPGGQRTGRASRRQAVVPVPERPQHTRKAAASTSGIDEDEENVKMNHRA
jgi:hypothetical protein